MYKHADIITDLQPHQREALERALAGNLIMAHSTGSGKTLTAIAAADALGRPAVAMVPASLVENFKKELAKHKKGGPPVEVVSLPTAVHRGMQIPEGSTLIVDEAHSLRNAGTARQQYVKAQAARAGRVLALTGTPAYNAISDYAPLVNMMAGETVLPEDQKAFRQSFINERRVDPTVWQRLRGARAGTVDELKNARTLRRILSRYVDVFDADVEKPTRTDEVVRTGMSDRQRAIYRMVSRGGAPGLWANIRYNLPPNKSQARSMNSFLSGVRQVSNTAEGHDLDAETGEKIKEAVRQLAERLRRDPGMRALVYSNYLQSGVQSYAKALDRLGIGYGMYTGGISDKERKSLVERYNAGELPVMLVSGAGSEGLDLKGTRLIQLLEPHWNDSRLEQVVGRGIRYKSHDELPPEKRRVLVQHYISQMPERGRWLLRTRDTSVDEYLAARAAEKQRLADQVKALMVRGKRLS